VSKIGPPGAVTSFGIPSLTSQACPNHTRYRWRRAAAPPPDLGKGLAFPKDALPKQPPPRRLEGSAFQPARRRTNGAGLAGKPEAFRKSGRRSRSQRQRELVIWTAVLTNRRSLPSRLGADNSRPPVLAFLMSLPRFGLAFLRVCSTFFQFVLSSFF